MSKTLSLIVVSRMYVGALKFHDKQTADVKGGSILL